MIGRRIPQDIFKRNPLQTLSGIISDIIFCQKFRIEAMQESHMVECIAWVTWRPLSLHDGS